jgi:segregation and condensation protein B
MEISQIIPHIESLIFAADRPLPLLEVLDLLNNALAFLEDRATLEQVEAALEAIKEKYSSEFYAFEVRESGGGYQFLTKKEYYQTVAQLNGEKFLKRLSTAALETLAIVAYKQPISKGEIEHIRGVSTDYSIQKLLEKELIVISGRSEQLPGKPLLYSTSKAFMDYFGLNSPKDLPKLKEVFEDEGVQPTLIGLDTTTESEEDRLQRLNMVVSENGELVEREAAAGDVPSAKLNGHRAKQDEDTTPAGGAVLFIDQPDDKDGPAAKGPVHGADEDIPVVDDTTDTSGTEDAEDDNRIVDHEGDITGNNVLRASDIPSIDEALSETADMEEEEVEENVAGPEDENEEEEADDNMTAATDEEIAAFLAAAADLGPKDEEEEDEDEEEDDENDEDDDEDEEGDDDEEDGDWTEDDEDEDEDDVEEEEEDNDAAVDKPASAGKHSDDADDDFDEEADYEDFDEELDDDEDKEEDEDKR